MPRIRTIVIALFVFIIGQNTVAAWGAESETDLYRVYIYSQEDADLLASLPVDPLRRLSDGYLVLVAPAMAATLTSSGLRSDLLAVDIGRKDLALDIRHDDSNAGKYPVVFEERGLRLVRLPSRDYLETTRSTGLAPIRHGNIPIIYGAPIRLDKTASVNGADLDLLLNSVLEDSLVSYTSHLQAYNGRWVGSYGNLVSANWCRDRLIDFGCDSVVSDTFSERIDGSLKVCRNIIGYKTGTEFPCHYIILGAHRDSDVDSPGADDNGSGMAAVLEIARVLSAVETRATIVFALFDAEENGLLGSDHYAAEANLRDDRIPFMLNMDMIANDENDSDANVYYDFDSEPYAQLWIDLADSIPSIGITGHLGFGGGGSDHASFQQYGYSAIFSHEYILSPYLHTPRDSTTYMNFEYMTRMVKASLATAYTVDRQFIPDYEILFIPARQFPAFLAPDESTPIELTILPYGGASILPGSVYLHYAIIDGDIDSIPMTDVGGGHYVSILPALGCFNRVEYQISVQDDSLGTIYYPEPPIRAFAAAGLTTLFYDDFGTDLGWQISGDALRGEWTRAEVIPWEHHAPSEDADGNTFCYLTGEKDNADLDGGTTTLISPVIDAAAGNVIMRYARWYANYWTDSTFDSHDDIFEVYISNDDGASWVPVETVGPVEEASGGWYYKEFWMDDIIAPSHFVRLRFDASDLGLDSHVEAAVDAVQFLSLTIGPTIVTEDLPDWTVGVPYAEQLKAIVCEGDAIWTDKFDQLGGTGLSLASDGMLAGIPIISGNITLVARAEAAWGESDEQIFTFYIHSALQITTPAVLHAILDESYVRQLSASGGTGAKTWTDRDDDLAETGVTLSPAGLLSGTPVIRGDFPFTALVTDQVGATAEKAFTLSIAGLYICGDADGDGAVNVGDAVYVINYVFKGGPAPDPIEAGDANADDTVNIADAVHLINFIFKGGPPPQCP